MRAGGYYRCDTDDAPLLIVAGYEASEDKVYKEPLLADPDEPPPAPVMLAEPAPAAPVAPVAPECSEPAYTEYPEHTGGLVGDWVLAAGSRAPVSSVMSSLSSPEGAVVPNLWSVCCFMFYLWKD